MGAFLIYVAKVAVVLKLFFLFNNLLLSHETFHHFNRIWWLASMAFSLVVPLFSFGIPGSEQVVASVAVPAQSAAGEVTVASVPNAVRPSALTTLIVVLFALYLAGALTFAALFILSNIRLHRQCKDCRRDKRGDIKVYVCDNELVPFSWGHSMMISSSDFKDENEAIFDHEAAHIHMHHTVDILLCNILIVFQWFNPCSWLTKRSIQKVHEFQADEKVLEKGMNLRNYQMLLIRKAVGHRLYSMANSFNHNDLKSRITMMSKSKSSKWACAKALYALPLMLLVATAFSTPEISGGCNEISNVKVSNSRQKDTLKSKTIPSGSISGVSGNLVSGNHIPSSISPEGIENIIVLKDSAAVSAYGEKGSDGVVVTVTKKSAAAYTDARFNGGDINEFSKWVNMRLTYPEAAKKCQLSMSVLVNFKVDSKGNVDDVKVDRISTEPESSGKSLNEIVVVSYGSGKSVEVSDKDKEAAVRSLFEEAEKVVKSSPKWKPAISEGKPVDAVYKFSINFMLR